MLDEALGWTGAAPRDKVLLIKDSVASPASFFLHYLLKKILTAPDLAQPLIIFVGLKEPFSHYSRIARKQGCNLLAHQDSGTIVYIDLLSAFNPNQSNLSSGDLSSVENKLFPLFQSFLRILRQKPGQSVWIIIDDLSLLEVVAEGNKTHLLDFIHYCRTLACDKQMCSLVLLAHQDVYETADDIAMVHQLEHWSDIVINVEPLATGQASDVHGQVMIKHRMPWNAGSGAHSNANQNKNFYVLHYKLMENTVLFFAPGKQV